MIKELKIYTTWNDKYFTIIVENVEDIKLAIHQAVEVFFPGKKYITPSIKKHGDIATAKVKILRGKNDN